MGNVRDLAVTSVIALALLVTPAAVDAAAGGDSDPLAGYNHAVFWFNDRVDMYVLEPVATAWDVVLPQPAQNSVSRFFDNLRSPIVMANNLLQGKFRAAGSDIARFAANSTVGFLGLYDPATVWGLERHEEDFGQTMGYWGIPSGPYLVLPFFGPSSPRDAVGVAVDSFGAVQAYFIPFYYLVSATGVNLVNSRSLLLDQVRELKRASIDYYAAIHNAYVQRREAQVADRAGMSDQQGEELYNMEEGE